MRLLISNGSEENKMEIRKGSAEHTVVIRTTNANETTRLIVALSSGYNLRLGLWISNLIAAINRVATGKSESVSFVDEE